MTNNKKDNIAATYQPKPLKTAHIILEPALQRLVEQLAENTHEVWSAGRTAGGWKYGPTRDDVKKEHPGLVPYVALSEEEKDFDRRTTEETIKALLALGYEIRKSPDSH